jgi:hypothetical protein
MKSNLDWSDSAFFSESGGDSLDGGTTSEGALWHAISPRWGHSMHTMCSYHGMFPARLVHYFIQAYTRPGDLILDPFSGRGTSALQGRVEGRRTVSNDLSPLGYVLTAAKSNPPSWEEMAKYVSMLETRFRRTAPQDLDVPEDIRMLYHDNTLTQLVYLRNHLLRRPMANWGAEQLMLAGTVAGILHGSHRSDGTSMYLSISMPNTFSMPPTYVKKFIRENELVKIDQDVFSCLRDKLARIYLDADDGPMGSAHMTDASSLLGRSTIKARTVDLVITSPPYLKVVNYGTSNWIRLWWLGLDEVSRHAGAGRLALDSALDHKHTYGAYSAFLLKVFRGIHRVLKPSGVAVVVIGDVNSKGSTVNLAQRIWSDIEDASGLRLVSMIEDDMAARNNRVSRIWGDTKGNATDRDCILVLSRRDGEPAINEQMIDWDEPYKDGGPDAAHARVLANRRSTISSGR